MSLIESYVLKKKEYHGHVFGLSSFACRQSKIKQRKKEMDHVRKEL